MVTRTAEPIVLAFKPPNIPTLADGQKVVSEKVPEQGTNLKKTEVLNDLTCILHFLFYLYNTQKCSEGKGKHAWITCRLDSYHNQFLYALHWVL